MAHGIGRAGDVAAIQVAYCYVSHPQPKAAGSSIICELTRKLSLDFIQTCGITEIKDCLVLPLATGMSITMCLLSYHLKYPKAKYVIWCRVDQKTCLKSILNTGLEPIIIEPKQEGDELVTNLEQMRHVLETTPKEEILCIIPTTSVFAPRLPDDIIGVSKLGKEFDIPVVVNNAYGLQSSVTCKDINRAIRVGRVDVLISSTDKNIMVPVGGTFVYAPNSEATDLIRKNYPGRANMSPILDVFITLLGLGKHKLQHYLQTREECYDYLKTRLAELAQKYTQRVLHTPRNPISIAVTLDHPFTEDPSFDLSDEDITRFGAMLYTRGVSGARCVGYQNKKSVGPYEFANYGGHCDGYPHAYFTAASAIGIEKQDVDVFISRLDKNWKQYLKELAKKRSDKESIVCFYNTYCNMVLF